MKNLNFEYYFEIENEGMLSLIVEFNQCIQELNSEKCDSLVEEIVNILFKEEEDVMFFIGFEILVCYEVDLDDLDEKEKISVEDVVVESLEFNFLVFVSFVVFFVVQYNFLVVLLLIFSQDEFRSIKSESDIIIEVDSIVEEF